MPVCRTSPLVFSCRLFRLACSAVLVLAWTAQSVNAQGGGRGRAGGADYPAVLSNSMSNTDSGPFMDLVAAVSLRENRRLYETGRGANPHWHRATDLFVTFSDADFRLGFNAAQTTLAALARLVEARIVLTP